MAIRQRREVCKELSSHAPRPRANLRPSKRFHQHVKHYLDSNTQCGGVLVNADSGVRGTSSERRDTPRSWRHATHSPLRASPTAPGRSLGGRATSPAFRISQIGVAEIAISRSDEREADRPELLRWGLSQPPRGLGRRTFARTNPGTNPGTNPHALTLLALQRERVGARALFVAKVAVRPRILRGRFVLPAHDRPLTRPVRRLGVGRCRAVHSGAVKWSSLRGCERAGRGVGVASRSCALCVEEGGRRFDG